ncbi:MAG: hypothetical protein JKX76_01870 [Colwellia sp.]|nr:hypothetical protein [Colwellia sp.]
MSVVQNVDIYKFAYSGALSGFIEVLCVHPFDYVKTNIQNSGNINTLQILKRPSILYSGVIPRMTGLIPIRAVFWGGQKYFNKKFEYMPNVYRYALSGILAGSVETLIDNPFEIAKIKHMNLNVIEANNQTCMNVKPTIRSVIPSIFYDKLLKGFVPNLYRNSMYAMILNSVIHSNYTISDNKIQNNFIKGGTGGVLASIVTQPFDYVKTHQQRISCSDTTGLLSQYRSMINIIKTQKWSTLYRGVIPRSSISIISMGIGSVITSEIIS